MLEQKCVTLGFWWSFDCWVKSLLPLSKDTQVPMRYSEDSPEQPLLSVWYVSPTGCSRWSDSTAASLLDFMPKSLNDDLDTNQKGLLKIIAGQESKGRGRYQLLWDKNAALEFSFRASLGWGTTRLTTQLVKLDRLLGNNIFCLFLDLQTMSVFAVCTSVESLVICQQKKTKVRVRRVDRNNFLTAARALPAAMERDVLTWVTAQ